MSVAYTLALTSSANAAASIAGCEFMIMCPASSVRRSRSGPSTPTITSTSAGGTGMS